MNVGTLQHQFLGLAIECGVLRFGEFTLKSGRPSPYFFNLGAVSGGMALARLGQCYARAWIESGIAADVLFGPAYKGIPVAVATAIAAAGMGRDIGVAYNRKEAKGHGEGGVLVGAAVTGRVLLVDDVLTAGTAVRESMDILATAGARPVGLLVAFDRRERGTGTASALEEVGQQYGIPVRAIATLDDLIDYQAARGEPVETLVAHREHHGAAAR